MTDAQNAAAPILGAPPWHNFPSHYFCVNIPCTMA